MRNFSKLECCAIGAIVWIAVAGILRAWDRRARRKHLAQYFTTGGGGGVPTNNSKNAKNTTTTTSNNSGSGGGGCGEIHLIPTDNGHTILARWSPHPDPRIASTRPAIVIPNGMAATMSVTDLLHEKLVGVGGGSKGNGRSCGGERGHQNTDSDDASCFGGVLSFDRPGCGCTALFGCVPSSCDVPAGKTANRHRQGGAASSNSGNGNVFPSVEICVSDMHCVMQYCDSLRLGKTSNITNKNHYETTAMDGDDDDDGDSSPGWIIIGCSMGSIVGQSYSLRHPNMIKGFVNVDGLPHPFYTQRVGFIRMGYIYSVYGCMAWLGILRPFLFIAFQCMSFIKQNLGKTALFPSWFVRGEMNDPEFFWNVAKEMKLMMDLAEDVSKNGWGNSSNSSSHQSGDASSSQKQPSYGSTTSAVSWSSPSSGSLSVDMLPSDLRRKLSNLRPWANGSFTVSSSTGGTFINDRPRAVAEQGADWETEETAQAVYRLLLERVGGGGGASNSNQKNLSDVTTTTTSTTSRGEGPQESVSSQPPPPPPPPLYSLWTRRPTGFPVRVLSARSYNYMGGERFYTPQMREYAAAEHTMHALLSTSASSSSSSSHNVFSGEKRNEKDVDRTSSVVVGGGGGRRIVFPHATHGSMFFDEISCIVHCAAEVVKECI